MHDLDEIIKKETKDPKFKKEFEKQKMLFEIAVKIAKAREAQGLSQGELAKKANVTQQQISRIETGYSSNIATFIKVLNALGLYFDIIPQNRKPKAA